MVVKYLNLEQWQEGGGDIYINLLHSSGGSGGGGDSEISKD